MLHCSDPVRLTVQYIMCSSCAAGNGLQAVFGLAVITSGNHNKAYIRLAWSAAIRCPNGFLWSWHGALCFSSSLSIALLQEEGKAADKELILKVLKDEGEKKLGCGCATCNQVLLL